MLDGAPGTLVGRIMDALLSPPGKHGSNPLVDEGSRVVPAEVKRIAVPQQQAVELESDRFSII